MAKEALLSNTFTKEALAKHPSVGQFGIGQFGVARFGQKQNTFPKEALPVNTFTKEAITNQIT